jgi:phosphohistidine phosphatase
MRYLTIIRHAKAADSADYSDDFDRPLTDRGERDAALVGRMLVNMHPPIGWWIVSAAERALKTGIVLRAQCDDIGDLHVVREAYLASPDTLLSLVQMAPAEIAHVALVAHNPGLEELVAGLTAGDGRHINFRLATGAFAHIELDTPRWDQVRWGSGQLRYLVAPKLLRK